LNLPGERSADVRRDDAADVAADVEPDVNADDVVETPPDGLRECRAE
jgi:hypothetical protein